jgi:hypothetical protein
MAMNTAQPPYRAGAPILAACAAENQPADPSPGQASRAFHKGRLRTLPGWDRSAVAAAQVRMITPTAFPTLRAKIRDAWRRLTLSEAAVEELRVSDIHRQMGGALPLDEVRRIVRAHYI